MIKFTTDHDWLEVIQPARYKQGYLNRQIITLLTSQGVPDANIEQLQEAMVEEVERMLSHRPTALRITQVRAWVELARAGDALGVAVSGCGRASDRRGAISLV